MNTSPHATAARPDRSPIVIRIPVTTRTTPNAVKAQPASVESASPLIGPPRRSVMTPPPSAIHPHPVRRVEHVQPLPPQPQPDLHPFRQLRLRGRDQHQLAV